LVGSRVNKAGRLSVLFGEGHEIARVNCLRPCGGSGREAHGVVVGHMLDYRRFRVDGMAEVFLRKRLLRGQTHHPKAGARVTLSFKNKVSIAVSTMTATHSTQLALPRGRLLASALAAYIVPGMTQPLLSIGRFCDAGCAAVLRRVLGSCSQHPPKDSCTSGVIESAYGQ